MHYTLALEVDPRRDRFAGTVEIALDLARPRDVLWLHGRGLVPRAAGVRLEGGGVVDARYEEVDGGGLAALRLGRPVGPGRVTARIAYDSSFGNQLKGLYKVSSGGSSYAFTQMEPNWARDAFPCLDEPAFKTPFDVIAFVPAGDRAIGNAREVERAPAQGGLERITFATTAPLPTYLVALAVGPLDVVPAPDLPPSASRRRPLPFRGVAAKGHGPQLAYALERTGPILATLEGYFGIEYPYDKLDVLAVPDMGGAMENAGAVTFNDWLLLVGGDQAPLDQRRAFASVMAHELAHQWFGNLVTMPWWDDIWLNEAFATWMAARVVDAWRPEDQASIALLSRVHDTMGQDSLLASRQIRQPVTSQDDIDNAFDGITYIKGGAVIGMFERWLGADVFQTGIREYMRAHRFGSGTSTDFLGALSTASKKDVATPFRTFLDQPGVPYVEAALVCAGGPPRLHLVQSRFLPLGSSGDASKRWQIPVCARFAAGKASKQACTLLTEREGDLVLDPDPKAVCPAWVMPNADAAGYFRWSLPRADLARLEKAGYAVLGVRERMSVAASLRAAFAKASMPAADVMASMEPLAADAHPEVSGAPIGLIETARDWLDADPLAAAVEAYGKKLYGAAYDELGWAPKKGKAEPPERQLRRKQVITFLALTARDPKVRAEAAKRGRAYVGAGGDGAIHPEAVDANLAGLALMVAAQEGDAAFFDALLARLSKTDDPLLRGRVIAALGAVTRPELAARARELPLDPRLRVSEALAPLYGQLDRLETREAAWQWLVAHLDALVERIAPRRAGGLPWAAARFCDRAHADAAARLFQPRLAQLEGSPRNLAGALEQLQLCEARRAAQAPSFRAFFKAMSKK